MLPSSLNLSAKSILPEGTSRSNITLGLAVVQAKALEGELDVRLKWPNDIYYKTKVKLGRCDSEFQFTGQS